METEILSSGLPRARRSEGVFTRPMEWDRVDSNPFTPERKPRATRKRAVVALAPVTVERVRAMLIHAHVIAELRDTPPVRPRLHPTARRFLLGEARTPGGPHDFSAAPDSSDLALAAQALHRTRTDDPVLTMEDCQM